MGAVVIFIVCLFLYFWLRDSPGNNMRRARRYHRLGEKYYLIGDEEESKLHYEAAKFYREKALEQMGEQ